MNVIFKKEPVCLFRVLEETETEYKVPILEWVPKSLMEESDRTDLIDPVDLYIEILKQQ